MIRLFRVARRLRELGVLGMNGRNAAFILDHNPRRHFPVVDDKLRMHELCGRLGVPSPAVYGVVRCHSELGRFSEILGERSDFVVKPCNGSAGRGVLVLTGRERDAFVRHNGERLGPEQVRQHLSDILSGLYSLGGRPDQVLLQQRVRLHPTFAAIAYKGIPDIRVILFRGEPAMAMLRLPTRESNGRANLHQGGIGAGVDLASGFTHHAVQGDRLVDLHPDTGRPVIGVRVPYWRDVLAMSRRVSGAVDLGYLGVDIVVDEAEGPMLLEANARPGLAIQIANRRGLLPALQAIESGREGEDRSILPFPGRGQRLRKTA